MSDRFLQGRRALVTGSVQGIGLAMATELARAGATVLLHGLPDAAVHAQACAAVAAAGSGAVQSLDHNLADPAAVDAMMDAVLADGPLDILVNNAGIQHVARIADFPPARWDAVIAINLSAAFHAIRCALPRMQSRGWGRIINVASVHGLVASVEKVAYVAAKHGIVGLTKVVALEQARGGVTCNAICPGWVLTPLVQKQIDDRAKAAGISAAEAKVQLVSEKQPSQEFVTPQQIGELAVFLCSDAASQVRGAAWNIDGGWAAQ